MTRKLIAIVGLLAAGILCLAIGWANIALYRGPVGGEPSKDVVPQLNNIGRRLRAGEGTDMQQLFPEGWLFSHVLYGMAWVNVGMRSSEPSLRSRAISEARWVLAQTETPEGLAPFKADTQVPHGVFYLAWKNRLLGGLLKLVPAEERTPAEVALLHSQTNALASAYRASQGGHLDAYPGQAWACDGALAISSLRLHDELFGTDHQDVIDLWMSRTKAELDPETGLIPHQVGSAASGVETRPRGASQAYFLAFLPEIDPVFARDQYDRFRRRFVVDWMGYLPAREYAIGAEGQGDVDSGPLIFGIGPAATVAAIAAARANGDDELAERNVILSETISLPWSSGGEKSFAFGQIIVADAFLAWGKSLIPWATVPESPYPATTSPSWRLRIHLVSGLVLALGIYVMWKCGQIAFTQRGNSTARP